MEIVKIENLRKYYGNNRGIENVTFSVNKGEIFGFIGPNGSGKSTTIRILMGLIKKDSGNATVFDKEAGPDSSFINKRVGYVPSEINFYNDMRVGEFLDYSSKLKNGEGSDYSELVTLFELDVTKRIKELSFGNKKKVGIINAFLNDPELIILDEPTSGLDPLMQKRFYDLIKKSAKKGKTIVLSSHNLNEVKQLCERVAIIKEGEIVKIDEVHKIKEVKQVSITTKEKINFEKEEIRELVKQDYKYEFNYSGNINDLLKFLSAYELENVSIKEADLEETFKQYYERDERNENN